MSAKSKSAALTSSVAVMKSKAPPIKAPREYFVDAYAEAARVLQRYGDAIFEGDPTDARADLMPLYREFDAARALFERDDLYRTRKVARADLLGTYTHNEITRRVVTPC